MTKPKHIADRERSEQLERFITAHLGDGWKAGPIAYLDGEQAVAALWPMIDVFRAHMAAIGSLTYDAAYEDEADLALAQLAAGGIWTDSDPSPGAWRVLLERHTQSIAVAATNEAAGNIKLVPCPQVLPPAQHGILVMLFLQWAMVLPLPPSQQPSLAWPPEMQPKSLRKH